MIERLGTSLCMRKTNVNRAGVELTTLLERVVEFDD